MRYTLYMKNHTSEITNMAVTMRNSGTVFEHINVVYTKKKTALFLVSRKIKVKQNNHNTKRHAELKMYETGMFKFHAFHFVFLVIYLNLHVIRTLKS